MRLSRRRGLWLGRLDKDLKDRFERRRREGFAEGAEKEYKRKKNDSKPNGYSFVFFGFTLAAFFSASSASPSRPLRSNCLRI
jgi:hypothetical protein